MTQPLYNQLVDYLREQIEFTLQPHDKLLSERELVKRYQMSRTTVRQALLELERLGYIYKIRGKGSFVADNQIVATNLSTMYSFTDKMLQEGKVPTTIVVSFEKVKASKKVAIMLNIVTGDGVYKIRRIRLADGQAMMTETTYLPEYVFKELTQEKVEKEALYNVFATYQQVVQRAEEEIFSSIVRYQDATIFKVPVNSPALHLRRLSYNQHNQIIEWTQSVARADLFKYTITHYH